MADVKNKKLVSAGHICLDITPAFPKEKVSKIEQVLIPGRLIQMGEADVHTGGSVGNTGLAMKVLGADVSLMGKVGRDAFGQLILSKLADYGIDKGMILSEDSETSYSVVLAPYGVDRIFLHDSGCNDTYSMKDLNFDIIREASIFHFGYPTIMKKMYKENGSEVIRIFKKVKELGVATSLDMASVDENGAGALVDWREIIRNLIPYVDFFSPSVEELAYMIDKERFFQWQERANGGDITSVLSIEDDIRPLADMLLSWGAKVILIKCGAPGLYLRTSDSSSLGAIGGDLSEEIVKWADLEHFEKSYKPTRVLSGTGAGDTSIAAFLTAISKGYSWETCIQLAAATGACCVSAYDSISGLKSFSELLQLIESGWEKN